MTPSPQQRILLVGYYGKGNFGDDVLLKVTHSLVKQALPLAELSVITDGDDSDYVASMLGDVRVLKPGRHGRFDVIVHGGGGVFFDFGTHGMQQKIFEKLAFALGMRTYLIAEKMLRILVGKPRTSATRRIGMGIGVGTYACGSPKLRENLPTLADFAALWVRDDQSVTNLKRFHSILRAEVIEGSDLAFLAEYWMPSLTTRAPTAKPRLGVVLRDWNAADEASYGVALAALAVHYTITGFIFDARADPRMQALLRPYHVQIWRPQQMDMAEFAAALAAQEVLLTSRFHGAICGACLGVPSVILDIEPKLAQVHAMLPHASRLVSAQDTTRWERVLEEVRGIPQSAIAADVEANRRMSEAARKSIKRWLHG